MWAWTKHFGCLFVIHSVGENQLLRLHYYNTVLCRAMMHSLSLLKNSGVVSMAKTATVVGDKNSNFYKW